MRLFYVSLVSVRLYNVKIEVVNLNMFSLICENSLLGLEFELSTCIEFEISRVKKIRVYDCFEFVFVKLEIANGSEDITLQRVI